jgi:hypothetical protein
MSDDKKNKWIKGQVGETKSEDQKEAAPAVSTRSSRQKEAMNKRYGSKE